MVDRELIKALLVSGMEVMLIPSVNADALASCLRKNMAMVDDRFEGGGSDDVCVQSVLGVLGI